ncbi:MAG: hypothetical protein RIS02_500, partial [Pseudomonadota bacterium]
RNGLLKPSGGWRGNGLEFGQRHDQRAAVKALAPLMQVKLAVL